MADYEFDLTQDTKDYIAESDDWDINETLWNGEWDIFLDNFETLVNEEETSFFEINQPDSTIVEELENFEPGEGDLYHAAEAMEHWDFQGDTNRCGQFSQMHVIEEFYGIEIDPDEFCAFAEANGWFTEKSGTTLDNANKMLDYFGIENSSSYGNEFEDLLDCLNNGDRVIVAVDADEYWSGESDESLDTYPGQDCNHAIEVIGYDPETDCVIVNDSGTDRGCGLEIPRETFINAWEDSDSFMVDCKIA